jgi:hypothetical protein
MRSDIELWVKRCPTCQVFARLEHQPRAPAILTGSPVVFQRWGIDAIGPLPIVSRKGNRYILHAKDHASRWETAMAVPDITTKTTADFVYEQIFLPYGPPAEIISDRGSNFCAQVLREYLARQAVHHIKTSAYHPRSNAIIENGHWILMKSLAKAARGAVDRWDEFLPEVLYHLRRRKHATTGYTPYFLVFGQEPQLPGDLLEPPLLFDDRNPEDRQEMRARALEEFGVSREQARARSEATAAQAKERYDQLVRDDPLRVDDWVLMKRGMAMAQGRVSKFMSNWVGPYRVAEVKEYGTYRLHAPDGTPKADLVHRDRLKRCRVDPANLPRQFWSDEVLEEYDRPEDFNFPFPDAILNAVALTLGAHDINFPIDRSDRATATTPTETDA